MIRSSVTISLVEQARGGPFVFWDDLPAACVKARQLGFDAVELFAAGPDAVDARSLRQLLADHSLELAAVGTGAGWVVQRLSLTAADPAVRQRAVDFVRRMIDFGAAFSAPAIIGSMQGRWGDGVDRAAALGWLAESLARLSQHAAACSTMLLVEPLNRYETNLLNTIADGVQLIEQVASPSLKLLADLFHMNIEETDIAAAIRAGGQHIGHVHFVDSNRQAAGRGHLDFGPIVAALKQIAYQGYLSAEALPIPDPDAAARQTIEAFRRWFG